MIVPDELCTHVEMGEQMAGGVVFAAESPPVNVGMCAFCLEWCRTELDSPQPVQSQVNLKAADRD